MEVSDKLAREFHTILLSHTLMLLLLIPFTAYVYFRAKKSPLLYSYLAVVGMIALWMTAKILKTTSPVIGLRWLFIVIQYFAIDSLGVCLLVFAFIYRKDRLPSKKLFLAWCVLPGLSFLVMASNPLHMTFYSYFDIYKDRFGPAFYFAQSVQYLYLFAGVVMLSRGFTKQPGFGGRRALGSFFAVLVVLPLLVNAYYLLFKMSLLPWFFPFPVFDFTPIAAALSLMLFVIPTLAFRFFDMSPVSQGRLYDSVPQGLVFADEEHRLNDSNRTFYTMLHLDKKPASLERLPELTADIDRETAEALINLVDDSDRRDGEFLLTDGRRIKAVKHAAKSGHVLLCLSDITEVSRNQKLLAEQNQTLEEVNRRLSELADTTRALAVARTKSQIAQNVHDILGHSLTVVIGTAELAAGDDVQEAERKVGQIEELLTGSLSDLRNALNGRAMNWGETTLIKAIRHLQNENILMDFQVHGKVCELSGEQTEAVYRLCQEAVTNAIKHGKAGTIYLILRFQPQEVEIYAVDNGRGCGDIRKSYGLHGIEARFEKLCGSADFYSDGESGFTVHARLPIQCRD